ncbi:MAG: carboxypeptidase regulatory-like domain-containing protein [Bryobacterales bacterium]|nr:carboxypeptidase regulatory-like domain-containing protein [Bryobacterales bacterium]
MTEPSLSIVARQSDHFKKIRLKDLQARYFQIALSTFQSYICLVTRSILLSGVLALVIQPSYLLAGYDATVTGKVVDDKNKGLAAADVIIARMDAPPNANPQPTLRTTSDKEGSFEFKGLSEGSYLVCARILGSNFLDSCAWPSSPLLAVADKQVISNYVVVLETGKELIADVADAGEVLETRGNVTGAATFMFGVWAPNGEWHPARMTSRTRKARQYLLVVPFDKPIKIKAYAHKLNVEDETAKKLKREDPPVAFQEAKASATASSPKRLRFTIRNYEP